MRVGVDISPLTTGHKIRGVGFYVKMLQKYLPVFAPEHEYIFFTNGLKDNVDIVHYPYFDPFFLTHPIRKKHPTVITVHDVIPIKFKNNFPSGVKGAAVWVLNKKILSMSDAVITDSKASQNDITALCGIPEKNTHVVYLAVDKIFVQKDVDEKRKTELKKKYRLEDQFFMYIGDVTWNKNVPSIMEAAVQLKVSMLFAGKSIANPVVDATNPWNKDLVIAQHLLQQNSNLVAPGFVSEDDLVDLLNFATALVMPSRYEGFGLPVLEAMSCGCPVITSRNGSLPEVAGEAGEYVEGDDAESIAKKMKLLLTDVDVRTSLQKKSRKQAEKFSIEQMIHSTAAVYASVVKK